MRLPSLLFTAALALTADAFLVPPELSSHGTVKTGVLDIASAVSSTKQIIDLECQNCLAAVGKSGVVAYRAVKPNHGDKMSLEMKFEVQDGTLLLNDGPIYPPPRPGSQPVMYTARQIVSGPSSDFFEGALPLSVSVEIDQTQVIRAIDGTLKIHPIKVEPIGLGQFPVHTPTVHVKLAELENGEFKLLPLVTSRYRHDPAADACKSIMCRARHVLAAKMAAVRAAAMAKIGHALSACRHKLFGGPPPHHPSVDDAGHGRQFDGFHGHHGHGFQSHHHHRHHGFRAAARRMLHHIFLPILFGIFTGALLGAAVMLVFTAVRAVARRARGERLGAYAAVSVDEIEEGRASVDEPPKYEHVYVEAEEGGDEKDSETKELLSSQRA